MGAEQTVHAVTAHTYTCTYVRMYKFSRSVALANAFCCLELLFCQFSLWEKVPVLAGT